MKNLVVLLGPTGIGKTDLCISLAKEMRCPILNCDSRQLFRDLQIGTAAPTPQQLAQVKHYFVGTLALDEYYSAAQYEEDALKLLEELFKKYDTILLSGGSMMYIDAVCKGIDDIPTIDEQTRSIMKQRLEEEGLEALVAELKELDPAYYAIADHKNTRRIVHAIEICHMTGKSYTSFRTQQTKNRPFNILKIGLQRPRVELFDRINQRVDQMVQDGLLNEVRQFRSQRHLNALNTVGYKEINEYLDIEERLHNAHLSKTEYKAQVEALRSQGKLPTLTDAIERIKKNTRVYAKKQMTWFAKDDTIHWFHPTQTADIRQTIIEFCK